MSAVHLSCPAEYPASGGAASARWSMILMHSLKLQTGTTWYYVTSSSPINQIYKQSKVFTMSVIQLSWGKNCFSWSDDVLRKSSTFREELIPADRNIAPNNIIPLVQSFAQNISRVSDVVTRYGPTLNIEEFYEDWKNFDEGVWKVALMYPTRLCRRFLASRARVRHRFWECMNKPHEPGQLVRDTEEIVRNGDHSNHDLGVSLMAPYWPLMANVPWASGFSSSRFNDQKVSGPSSLSSTPQEKPGPPHTPSSMVRPYADNLLDFVQSLPPILLLTSTISETLRFTSDSYSMGGGCIRMRNEFERAEEFVPTRFMGKDGKGTESEYNYLPFGGGVSMCSGRFFAFYHIKIFLTTVLKNFKLEVDRVKSTPVVQSGVNRGFGLRRPKGQMYVKVRRI
ncbi:Cholesterol 7-alpha-monooxygenase [Tulasnella sp. 424]|nr:Cholesterol 7-alpha-monooxygenase [Tulasnella sp. 424]